jgi:hypothetical protein
VCGREKGREREQIDADREQRGRTERCSEREQIDADREARKREQRDADRDSEEEKTDRCRERAVRKRENR